MLFDLDGTLRHNQPPAIETFLQFLQELGHEPQPERLREGLRWDHYYWSVAPERATDLKEFGGETRQFWERHTERQLRAFGFDGDVPALAAQISGLFFERYRPTSYVPDEGMATLRRLHALGYKVGLVSNRTEPLDTLVTELGLADFFLFTLSAGQAESWKPDKPIFLKAMALAGCSPECTVYVGDNYYADVVGARAAGMVPILLDPQGIFVEPGCRVIRSLGELEAALEELRAVPVTP